MNNYKTIKQPERELPVLQTDVLVAGAGTAGCIAAIAAAREGANVTLIEKLPVPGGTLGNGGIGWSNYYAATGDDLPAKRIVGGLPYELAQRLENNGGSTGFLPQKKDHYKMPYRYVGDHEPIKAILSEMLLEAGITVFMQTMVCGVLTENGTINAVIIANKDGESAVVAKQYIDCTGDGDLARFAGLEQIEIWQDYDKVCGGPTGMVFGMGGIDFEKILAENKSGAFSLGSQQAADGTPIQRMIFTHTRDKEKYKDFYDLDINFFTNFQSNHPGEATYINNSRGIICDASKAEELSRAELEMRVKTFKMACAFKNCVPGFENSYMSWTSTQLGVRASHITVCDKSITSEDISTGARFEDEIGLYAFHDLSPKKPELLAGGDGFYGFPYRMLLPKGCDNLYMAGRCVTEELYAHMSTRNTVGCMVMGQAAGVAAAMAVENGITSREVEYKALREHLVKQKVILD